MEEREQTQTPIQFQISTRSPPPTLATASNLTILTKFPCMLLQDQSLPLRPVLALEDPRGPRLHRIPLPLQPLIHRLLPSSSSSSTLLIFWWSLSLLSLLPLPPPLPLPVAGGPERVFSPCLASTTSSPRGYLPFSYYRQPQANQLALTCRSFCPCQDEHNISSLMVRIFSIPILVLDVKIYGQWFTKGKKFLSAVANPTSQISVLGNLVGARAAVQMGFKEGAMCMFSFGIAHYLVLFVTLYQRFLGSDLMLPAMTRPVIFLFFAMPSMESVAWYSINGKFNTGCKMLFFLSLFLFPSLVSRPALFKRAMRRFNAAWWAYSFPLTLLALAATRYAQEVQATVANLMVLILSVLSLIVTLALMAFTTFKPSEILPRDNPFASSLVFPR